MPVLVDPKTGQQYDYDGLEGDIEADQKTFGLVSPEQYADRQAAEKEGAVAGFGRKLADPIVGLTNLGMKAGVLDSGTPEEQAQFQEALSKWGTAGEAHEAVHPVSSFAGNAVGQGILGAVAGGAGTATAGALGASPLLGAGAGVLTESALGGTSQEAVDAVTQKRDFSAKNALMNGVVNLALGGAGALGGHYWGKAFGAADEALGAADNLAGTSPLRPPSRNWVAEIDPGEVPAPLGGRRPARSAGAAAAANQEYGSAARRAAPEAPVNLEGRSLEDLNALPIEDAADRARVDALKANEEFAKTGKVASNDGAHGITLVDDDGDLVLQDGRHRLTAAQELGRDTVYGRLKDGKTGEVIFEGEIPLKAKPANDVGGGGGAEPFTDDLYEAATKSIDDATDSAGKKVGLDKEAQWLADPKTSKKLTELSAANVADTLDDVTKIARDDLSVAVKNTDARKLAQKWTPEHVEAQRAWLDDTVEAEAKAIVQQVDASRAAAADVRAGRAGARAAGADALDAGGLDTMIKRNLADGMDKIRRAEGAERAIAVDNLKRSIGAMDKDIARSGNVDVGTRKARQEMLKGFYTTLQQGLEDEAKFGAFGTLQKATNEAVTRTIEPLRRVQDALSKRLGDTYGKLGQEAINRETQAGLVQAMLRAEPAEQREFLRALTDASIGLDDMAKARQAHGVSNLGALPRLREGLLDIEKEFRFQDILKTAERRAGEVTPGLKDRLLSSAVDLAAGKVPIAGNALKGEGQRFLQGLRSAPEMPKPGTPLRSVLDERLKRYSRNVDLQRAGYSRQLPQWLQESLKGHGGQVAGVAGVGIGAGILGTGGEAHAADMLPEQRQARDELQAQLSTLPPDQQQTQIRTAEAFARIQKKTELRVSGAVQDLFALAKDPKAQPRHRSPEARRVDEKAQQLDVPRHLARFMGKEDDPTKAWSQKSKVINGIMEDPAKLARTMAENLGDLPQHQPEIFAKMVGQTMATVQYLHERMPGPSGQSALDPTGYPPTYEEISEWAGHYVGALHPLDTLDDLASNALVPEQMEAVQALWPEGYQMFQTTAMKEIHALSQSKQVIPLEALEQIDTALDLDGAGEPLLSSAFADLLKQANQKQAEKMQQQPPPPPQPMQSQASSRMGSSSLASLHGAQ